MKSFKEWQKLTQQAAQLRTQNREVMRETTQANRTMTDRELADFDRRVGEENDLNFRADTMAAELVVSGSCDWTRDTKGKAAIVERGGGRSSTPAHLRALADGSPDTRTAGMEDFSHRGGSKMNTRTEKRASDEVLAYRSWIQGGFQSMTREQIDTYHQTLEAADPSDLAEARSLGTTTNGGGAYTIPTSVMSQIDINQTYLDGPMQLAEVITTDDGRPMLLPTADDTSNTGEVIAESTAVADAGDQPVFGGVSIGAFNFDSKIIRVQLQLIQDSTADIEAFVTSILLTRLMRTLNPLLVNGTGSGQPQGCLTAAAAGPTAASVSSISSDDLDNLIYSVPLPYRDSPQAGFMFHENTLKLLQKLKDSTGRSLFSLGGQNGGIDAGIPGRLRGYPYTVCNEMPQIGASNKSILFGDWSKFKIRKVNQVSVFRLDQLYITQKQIGFFAWQRYDSRLINAGSGPLRYLVHPAS